MDNISKNPLAYWNKKVPGTGLERFKKIIEIKYNIKFESYWELHEWTVTNYTKFWEEIWHFFEVIASEPFKEFIGLLNFKYKGREQVLSKTGPGFLDNEWFNGAKLNYAENMLRIRDDRVALMCLDELGNEETVTYAQMFEEVKMYAAAFRKNGLEIGDRVACFMSNRKEAIFAMLAVASIGGIWGGPNPFYGAKAASNIINLMKPKFLISIDSHQDNGIIFSTLDYLPEIVINTPAIEKVILVVTKEETRTKDLSNIPKCVFLEDFLQDGRAPDGSVPDIVFEQLSFNQPLNMNFTSGTTGLPKTMIHSAGTMLSIMRDQAISYNLKTGDVVCMNLPVGWSVWDNFIPCLGLGLPFFLHCGNVYYSIKGRNFWDLLGKYKVKMVLMVTSQVDKLEKLQILPSLNTDLTSLKEIIICGSPVKKENFEYLLTKVQKDLFVGIMYGATEVFGTYSGFDWNLPIHGEEIQVPSLGIDIKCYDSQGKNVVGQRGELVICKPAVNFLTTLWEDKNKTKLTNTYLSQFPGVWTQHDECWINPKTNGIVVIGRSDETLKQKGERFGSSEIYFAIHSLDELEDYLCVSQRKFNGDCRAVLFVKTKEGFKLTPELRAKIEKKVNEELWEDCVPELIYEVIDIPYNLNNKRMESLVRKIIENNEIPEVMNIRNSECLKNYLNIPEIVNYNIK